MQRLPAYRNSPGGRCGADPVRAQRHVERGPHPEHPLVVEPLRRHGAVVGVAQAGYVHESLGVRPALQRFSWRNGRFFVGIYRLCRETPHFPSNFPLNCLGIHDKNMHTITITVRLPGR